MACLLNVDFCVANFCVFRDCDWLSQLFHDGRATVGPRRTAALLNNPPVPLCRVLTRVLAVHSQSRRECWARFVQVQRFTQSTPCLGVTNGLECDRFALCDVHDTLAFFVARCGRATVRDRLQ